MVLGGGVLGSGLGVSTLDGGAALVVCGAGELVVGGMGPYVDGGVGSRPVGATRGPRSGAAAVAGVVSGAVRVGAV